jgi:hypothetical protein
MRDSNHIRAITLADRDRYADDCWQHIQVHKKQFTMDWLPFLDNLYEHSMLVWERMGKPTKPDGTPDWGLTKLQRAFQDTVKNRAWAEWLRTRADILHFARSIGYERESFLRWYDAPRQESVRETLHHPKPLWTAYKNRHDRPRDDDQPRERGHEAHQEQQRTAARMDALAEECEQLRTTLALPEKKLAAKIRTKDDEIVALKKQIADLKAKLAAAEQEIADLKAKLAEENAS